MDNHGEYPKALADTLEARRTWLENTELVKLKEEFRSFHTAYLGLYNLFLKKGLIHEDPYKHEAKMGEIQIPETGAFVEAKRTEQLSIRLSNFDNQLDFLVNFYQFSVDFLTLDRIKKILGLVKYIDWVHLNTDSSSANTRAVTEFISQLKPGSDPLSITLINECLGDLKKATANILAILKEITEFQREDYKLAIRQNITAEMSLDQTTAVPQIRKKFAAAMPGKPFYPDLIEELVKEDYSTEGPALQEKVLNALQLPDSKPKAAKAPVSFKHIIVEGLMVIGSVAATLSEITLKFEENGNLLQNRRKSLWEKIRQILKEMLHKEPDPIIYEVEYLDSVKGVNVKEKINYNSFRDNMERRARSLTGITRSGWTKLEALQDEQLITLLEKNIREVQSLHKTLSALDDYFKLVIDQEDREKVRGIKPELATMKNAIIKANQKRHEYSAQKEEEEQLKRLGVSSDS
ncbi:hypothetical protein LQZ21_08690 [Treponema sp. TIM-1]|uniref:hypothetical protein n=1 Tax=Treponema sp. TIM-1 TaxID=2898417 RepID=UPI0039815EA9